MDPGIVVVLALAGAGLVALRRFAQREVTRRAYRRVARELGLEAVSLQVGLFGTPRLTGVVRGFTVVLAEEKVGLRAVSRITVSHLGAIPPSLEVRAETVRSRIDAALGERDAATGDDDFDAAVFLRGDAEAIAAIFTAAARVEARRLVGAGGRVHSGRVEREEPGRAAPFLRLLAATQEVLTLAGLVVAPSNPVGRLLANARKDPLPAVRRRNLELLVERHGGSHETDTALRRALHDFDPGLSLWAALRLGEDGRATLRELVADSRTPGAVAVGAAAALARVGDDVARDRLVAALADGDGDVRLAAADALGEVGTTAAVTPLRAAIAGHPLDLALRRAAATAIDAIQARATGAAPGQLSLAGGEAGALSLADEAGRGAVAVVGEGGEGGDDDS